MGMTAQYVRVTNAELQQILSGDAEKVDDLMDEKLDMAVKVHVGGSGKVEAVDILCKRYSVSGQWQYIEGKATECGLSEDDLLREVKARGLHVWFDLDKSYNELHLLLTGEEFPLELPATENLLSLALIAENNVAGTEDHGYGPARYLAPKRVEEIAATLASTNYSELAEKNNFEPEDWGLEHEDMQPDFEAFKNFYLRAAKSEDAILLIFL